MRVILDSLLFGLCLALLIMMLGATFGDGVYYAIDGVQHVFRFGMVK